MAQATVYKRTVGGSIGAGIGSVFGGSGRTYFILEHKTNSMYYRPGQTQEIIVDQIELGRDPKCQVRFDDSFATVSRRHAAIIKDGNRWKIVQLSSTNSTLLNGQKVHNESYLQNGDEIQLSADGPKMGFIVPTGNKATVGSIGLTRRLNLFGQQALRPYKQAITVLSLLLVLVIAGGVWWGMTGNRERENLKAQYARLEEDFRKAKDNPNVNPVILDSLKREMEKTKSRIVYIERGKDPAKQKTDSSVKPPLVEQKNEQGENQTQTIGDIKSCNPYVYAIFQKSLRYESASGEVINNELGLEFIGTGFLLEDGRFVTARHVVEPWYYFKHIPFYKKVNEYAFNGGEVSAQYQIISPTGRKYSFTNRQIICNRANDRTFTENGITYTEATSDRYDWAYFQTSESGGLKFDNGLSGTLEQGMQLAILGYPKGQGADDIDNLHPSLSQGITTFSGVNTNGMIISSNIDIIGGNSGSPVLAKKGDGYVVVGVVSGLIYQKGVIVPVREVR